MRRPNSKNDRSKGNGCCGCGGCPGCLLLLGLILLSAVMMWQAFKSLPTGLRVHGPAVEVSASEISVLADITAIDAQENELVQQEIFDRMLARISLCWAGMRY